MTNPPDHNAYIALFCAIMAAAIAWAAWALRGVVS